MCANEQRDRQIIDENPKLDPTCKQITEPHLLNGCVRLFAIDTHCSVAAVGCFDEQHGAASLAHEPQRVRRGEQQPFAVERQVATDGVERVARATHSLDKRFARFARAVDNDKIARRCVVHANEFELTRGRLAQRRTRRCAANVDAHSRQLAVVAQRFECHRKRRRRTRLGFVNQKDQRHARPQKTKTISSIITRHADTAHLLYHRTLRREPPLLDVVVAVVVEPVSAVGIATVFALDDDALLITSLAGTE